MNWAEVDQLAHLAQEREAKRYAFLRHLLLLASGALALLVSLKTDSAGSRMALWSLRVAWPALGLGILALATALHAEVWAARSLVMRRAERLKNESSAPAPVVVRPPAVYRACEPIAYAALATAVIALVCHGLARTM